MLRFFHTELNRGQNKGDRSQPMSWFKYNVEASTQFRTIHLFPIPVPASVNTPLLPPANEVCEGCFYTCLSVTLFTGGACVVVRGACVVAGGRAWLPGGHVWLAGGCVWLLGGMHCCRGACVVAGGHAWLWGACMVAGGHAWLPGGI